MIFLLQQIWFRNVSVELFGLFYCLFNLLHFLFGQFCFLFGHTDARLHLVQVVQVGVDSCTAYPVLKKGVAVRLFQLMMKPR